MLTAAMKQIGKRKEIPSWVNRYWDEIKRREISLEEIHRKENERRRKKGEPQIILDTVRRAVSRIAPVSELPRKRAKSSKKPSKKKKTCDIAYPRGRSESGQNIYYCGKYDLVIGEKAKLCKGCEYLG